MAVMASCAACSSASALMRLSSSAALTSAGVFSAYAGVLVFLASASKRPLISTTCMGGSVCHMGSSHRIVQGKQQ